MKRFQINEKELNYISEMFVYIQHDNEVSDEGLGQIKEVFDRVRSRPVMDTVIDPAIFAVDHFNDNPVQEEPDMTEQKDTTPQVATYLEFVNKNDVDGAKEYLVGFFGEDGKDDPEALSIFSKEVLAAASKKTELVLEEEAVAESTEIPEAAEEVEAVAKAES